MSETEHYKGTLTKVKRLENESLEEQCKRLLEYMYIMVSYIQYIKNLLIQMVIFLMQMKEKME